MRKRGLVLALIAAGFGLPAGAETVLSDAMLDDIHAGRALPGRIEIRIPGANAISLRLTAADQGGPQQAGQSKTTVERGPDRLQVTARLDGPGSASVRETAKLQGSSGPVQAKVRVTASCSGTCSAVAKASVVTRR